MPSRLLIINPGSTSTKLSIYEDYHRIFEKKISHNTNVLNSFHTIYEQLEYRKKIIIEFLKEHDIHLVTIDAFVGRGGMIRPVKNSGVYLINQKMIDDLLSETYGFHASNLGAMIAFQLANINNKKSYIVDPVVVDELDDIARVSGLKGIERLSIFHALNQKKVAKMHATLLSKKYTELDLIVCHLGGGVSVGLHKKGRVVDVNNALGGEGPFSPERSGTLPIFQVLEFYTKHNLTLDEMKSTLVGNGGLESYLGTTDGRVIRERINNGDKEAIFYIKAMAYQIAKEIGGLYFANKGKIDAILLTGGLTYFEILINEILSYLKPYNVYIYYGENEMEAMAQGVLRIIHSQEKINLY